MKNIRQLLHKFSTITPLSLILLGFLGGLLVNITIQTVLAHGGDLSLIHGCIRPVTGLLRIIGANDECGQNEEPLDWSYTGPTGATGVPGETGPAGATGAAGLQVGTFLSNDLSGQNLATGFPVNLTYRNFANVNFTNAFLSNVNFSRSDLSGSNFTGAILSQGSISFANATNTIFTASNLNSVSMQNVNAIGSNFSQALMGFVQLNNAILANVNFTNANMQNATGTPANITGAIWSNTICPNGVNSDNNGGTCAGTFN